MRLVIGGGDGRLVDMAYLLGGLVWYARRLVQKAERSYVYR
jgi:hypothetical protein